MNADDDDLAVWGRRAWAALEAVHVPGYFSHECRDAFEAIGLTSALSYFPARAAALGAVPAEVVVATFFGFAPRLVEQAVPACWTTAPPEQVLAARHAGVTATLHRLLDPVLDDGGHDALAEANALVHTACEGLRAPGRPLYAAHAALGWPDDPLLHLWHGATLVREHRGDGHVAALVVAGLSPLQAMWTYGLTGQGVSLRFLRRTRGWTDDEWSAAADDLRDHGLVRDAEPAADGGPGGVEGSGLELTADGEELRAELEQTTDLAALEGWEHLGLEGTQRLAGLLRPLARAVVASGALKAIQPRPSQPAS
ncbi:hypothetical protein GCM10027446_27380 [Angustibacter peucedani]